MGNIKSFCCHDNISDLDEADERARILGDNNGSSNSLFSNSSNPGQDDLSYGSMNNGVGSGVGGRGIKSVEQSALDKIYQKLAANVIDVAPGESMVIQTAEFNERQKAYQARLNQMKTAILLRSPSTSKVSRNPNSSILDPSVANTSTTSRMNKSISTAGANLTALNKLNTTNGTTTSTGNLSNATCSHYHNGGTSSFANTTTSTGVSSGNSTREVGPKDRPRVDYEPISSEDIQLINEISDKTAKAMEKFKVISSEPVVTTFEP